MNNKRRSGLVPVKKITVLFLVALVGFTILGVGVKALAPLLITDQIEVVGYQDGVDYYRQMRECAKDGSKYAMLVGEIYEEQRNFKIDRLNLPYEKTELFIDNRTGEEVLKAIDDDPPPTAKKIERLKSEYDVAGQVYEYLNTQGMSDIVIAGILGNMMTECGGQTLDLQWDIYGYDGSYYYGLCQWSLYYNPSVDGADITGQSELWQLYLRPVRGHRYEVSCVDLAVPEATPLCCAPLYRKTHRATAICYPYLHAAGGGSSGQLLWHWLNTDCGEAGGAALYRN